MLRRPPRAALFAAATRFRAEHRVDLAMAAVDSVRDDPQRCVAVDDRSMQETEQRSLRLLEDFPASLEQGRFPVWYQPKYDIRPENPQLIGGEALVRWEHPELGLIGPDVFIPLLAENGLILDLDRYVWRQAAAQVRAWKDGPGTAVPVSVNLSRIDLLMPGLPAIFRELLEEYALTPEDLVLEIRESAYAGNSEQVIRTARSLRDMGFRMEMENFGTGYFSLGTLNHLPVDALKLDRSVVQRAFTGERDTGMIALTLHIAEYLGVPVAAVGVESEEQYRYLKDLGCGLVQGYWFSGPIPPEDFRRYLEK